MPSLELGNVTGVYQNELPIRAIYSGSNLIWEGIPQDGVTDPNYFEPYNIYVRRVLQGGQYTTLIEGRSANGSCTDIPPATDGLMIWTNNKTAGTGWIKYGFRYPTWASCGSFYWLIPGVELFPLNAVQQVGLQIGEYSTFGPFGYSPLETYGSRT